MQFMPATWAAYGAGGDINDTRDAIMGAARYLAANNGATDIDNALFHYNRSHRYVRGVRLYADVIAEHPRAFLGYYHWGIWYLSDQGDVYLPVGYEQAEPIPVADYRSP
jgi:soluble lytic murein transglycosylase-like protein